MILSATVCNTTDCLSQHQTFSLVGSLNKGVPLLTAINPKWGVNYLQFKSADLKGVELQYLLFLQRFHEDVNFSPSTNDVFIHTAYNFTMPASPHHTHTNHKCQLLSSLLSPCQQSSSYHRPFCTWAEGGVRRSRYSCRASLRARVRWGEEEVVHSTSAGYSWITCCHTAASTENKQTSAWLSHNH